MKKIVEILEQISEIDKLRQTEGITSDDLKGLSVLLPETGSKINEIAKWFNDHNLKSVAKESETTTTTTTTTKTGIKRPKMTLNEVAIYAQYVAEKCNGNKVPKAMSKLSAYCREKYSARSIERFVRGISYADITSQYFIVDNRDKVISVLVEH